MTFLIHLNKNIFIFSGFDCPTFAVGKVGSGGTEVQQTSLYTVTACEAKCRAVGANGMTMWKTISGNRKGSCWCRTGMTGMKAASNYKTCKLAPKGKVIEPFLSILALPFRLTYL